MLKVGLTGGIASGKSVVGEMFVTLGAHLVQADRIAHELMLPGQPVYNEVVRHFGGGILNPDLSINRGKLAEAAFGSASSTANSGQIAAAATIPERIQELNRIVHPAVIRSQNEWMDEMGRQNPEGVAMVEAALKTLMKKRLFPKDIYREDFFDTSDKATGGVRSPLLGR